MAHPLMERAAQHNAQARAINDEFEGKDMPAEAERQMQGHLEKATELRRRVEREMRLKDNESWLSTPGYKHSPTDFGQHAAGEIGGTKAGEFLLASEKKDREKSAFFKWMKAGHAIDAETKAALVEDAVGEIIVPHDVVGLISQDIASEGTFRKIAWIRPTNRKRVDVSSLNVGTPTWGVLELGDAAADGLGNPPLSGPQTITVWDLNATVKIGVDELDDTPEAIESTIRAELAAKFTEEEDKAFANGLGDASKQPFGVAQSATVTQKVTAAAPGTLVMDDIIKLPYAITTDSFRNAGVYVGTASMEAAARILKDLDGRYMWQERVREGLPPLLNGRPWYTCSGLPAFTSDAVASKALFYGDFKRGYMIADRQQLTVKRLDELYAAEGKVGFLFRHRVGGDVVRPKALAFLSV